MDCPCKAGREEAMVVIRRNSLGTPAVWCDPCIADVIEALNAGGLRTVASCCGHSEKPGRISLADGREMLLLRPADELAHRVYMAALRWHAEMDWCATRSPGEMFTCETLLVSAIDAALAEGAK